MASKAADWDKFWVNRGPELSTAYREMAEAFWAGVKGRILELGCGPGYHIPEAPTNAFLDVSVRALQYLRTGSFKPTQEQIEGAHPLNLVVGDACRLPLRDKSYEAIVAIELTLHLGKECHAALREMARIANKVALSFAPIPRMKPELAKEQGVLTENLPGGGSIVTFTQTEDGIPLENLMFTPDEARKALEAAGFRVEHMVLLNRRGGIITDKDEYPQNGGIFFEAVASDR